MCACLAIAPQTAKVTAGIDEMESTLHFGVKSSNRKCILTESNMCQTAVNL